MNIAEIPVSRISARYLTAIYGAPPIVAPWSSALKSMLTTGGNVRRGNYSPAASHEGNARTTLTAAVQVEVSNRVAKRIEHKAEAIGWHIHNHVLEIMCQWVRAYFIAHSSNTVAGGIKAFYKEHNIDDDDYLEESSYKRIQRFAKRIEDARASIEASDIDMRHSIGKVKLSLSECEDVAEVLAVRCQFLPNSPGYNALFSFLAGAYARIAQRHISKRLAQRQQTVSRSVGRLSLRFVQDVAFRDLVADTVAEIRNRKVVISKSGQALAVARVCEPKLSRAATSLRERIAS